MVGFAGVLLLSGMWNCLRPRGQGSSDLFNDTPVNQPSVKPEGEQPPSLFSFSPKQISTRPLKSLRLKLEKSKPTDRDDSSLAEFDSQATNLGDYNFGEGYAPEKSWGSSKMFSWVSLLSQYCQSGDFSVTGAKTLAQTALGRTLTEAEHLKIDEIYASELTDPKKYGVVCLWAISNLEFVSQ